MLNLPVDVAFGDVSRLIGACYLGEMGHRDEFGVGFLIRDAGCHQAVFEG